MFLNPEGDEDSTTFTRRRTDQETTTLLARYTLVDIARAARIRHRSSDQGL
jgi:hypothetical protein